MKKILIIFCFLMLPLLAFAESKETLILKRDLAQERVLRIQAELSLMKSQFKEGQEYLKATSKELEDLNTALKSLEGAEKSQEKK